MRKVVLILGFLLCFEAKSQNVILLNEDINVSVFFKSNIKVAMLGSNGDFFVGYDKRGNNNYCTLKAIHSKKRFSNLTVITVDGLVYSYVVKYSAKVEKFNYFATIQDSENYADIYGNAAAAPVVQGQNMVTTTNNPVVPAVNVSPQNPTPKVQGTPPVNATMMALYNRIVFRNDTPFKRQYVKKQKFLMSLKNVYELEGFVYFLMEFHNQRQSAFEVGFFELQKQTNEGKKTTYQKQVIRIVDSYRYIAKIPRNHKQVFLIKVKKVGISEKENFLFVLKEKNSTMALKLPVYYSEYDQKKSL